MSARLADQLRDLVNDPRVVLVQSEKDIAHAAADRLDALEAVADAGKHWRAMAYDPDGRNRAEAALIAAIAALSDPASEKDGQ